MTATVLLVENERRLRELVQSYLERAGFTVLSTGSGAEAIALGAAAALDLVILDLGLPDVPGEMVVREIRETGPVPILMLTARAGEQGRIAELELGAEENVTKPFNPRELVLRVQAMLTPQRAGRRQLRRRDLGHRSAAPRGDSAWCTGGADADRVADPGGAGHGPGPGVLAV